MTADAFGRLLSAGMAAALGAVVLCAAPTHAQSPSCSLEWQSAETFRMGSVDGEVVLSGARDLEIGADGRIYMPQSWDHHVSVFTPEGRPAGRVGRAGSGPGEFASPPHTLGWKGDTLWVSDRFATHFFVDGRPVRQVSFRVPLAAEGSNFAPGRPLADGTFLPYRTITEQNHLHILARRSALRRLSATGAIVDTIAMIERPLIDFAIQRETDDRWWGVMSPHPLAAWNGESWLPVVAAADGSAVVFIGEVREQDDEPSFDLLMIGIDGDTLLHRAIPYEPQPVTPDQREIMRERFAGSVAGDFTPEHLRSPFLGRDGERRRRIARDLITFPDFHPPVREILAGSDGSIWLRREMWPFAADLWEVYDREGKLEGRVRIEARRIGDGGTGDGQDGGVTRLRVLRASRQEIWGQELGALDVPYIVRYRIERSCD